MVLNKSTAIPPPSTVSTVRANKLGVNASKSCCHIIGGQAHEFVSYSIPSSHLKYTHAVCVAKNLVCVSIVAKTYVSGSYEELKRIVFTDIKRPTLHLFLKLSHSLFPVTACNQHKFNL